MFDGLPPHLPTRDDCPQIIEVVQNPRENLPVYIVCAELPEFPSLPSIVNSPESGTTSTSASAVTTSLTRGIPGSTATTTTYNG